MAFGADTAVLWQDTGPVESLDLAGGPLGRAGAPQPPYKFVEEEGGGTAPKIIVTDGKGTKWSVKFGPEVKAETFATRIAWAAGYYGDPTYFVPEGRIEGANGLRRAASFIDSDSGSFREGRFELRDGSRFRFISGSRWFITDDEIKGTRELNGLKVLLTLLGNWDVKPENMAIVEVNGIPRYAVTDWGASMGEAGDFSGRSKWNCPGYQSQTEHFVQGVNNGFITLHYDGKARLEVLREIRVEDAKWISGRLSGLSDAQIEAALKASGATPEETECFSAAFRSRLDQLMSVGEASDGGTVIRSRRVIRVRKR